MCQANVPEEKWQLQENQLHRGARKQSRGARNLRASRVPQTSSPQTERGVVTVSATPSRGPKAMVRPEEQPGALPVGGGGGLPGLDSAPPPRSPPGHLRLLPAGPAASPASLPPPLTSARGRGAGHDSAGVGAARGRRPSALPLFTGSGLRRDAGGTNGLHYPRGPAIVRRHQAAPVVLRTGGLPPLAPPSVLFLPAPARPPPRALDSARRVSESASAQAPQEATPPCVCRLGRRGRCR